jgi:hypothetical protein
MYTVLTIAKNKWKELEVSKDYDVFELDTVWTSQGPIGNIAEIKATGKG